MAMTRLRMLVCAAFLAGLAPAHAQTTAQTAAPTPPAATPTASAPADYSNDANWLCRPGRSDACTQDQTASVVAANGQITQETFTANPNAPIDCFYVYPTVSVEPTPNSDLTITPAERNVVAIQFARFTSQCRPYAPMYRQVTLTALRTSLAGGASGADRALAYNDVLAAWRYYLANDNHGRGVVLISHSQGTGILIPLIHNEIDGKPVQAQLISAILAGGNLVVPQGADIGGAFEHIGACHAATQTGCVISYVSFREASPPPPISRFGKPFDIRTGEMTPNMKTLCTNPANLAGGSGVLHPYIRTGVFAWTNPPQAITTPFVSAPGLLSAHCVSDEHGTYLAVHVNADPADPRADDIPGDVIVGGQVQADWGLHLIDISEAQGDLVDIVRQQSAAYVRTHRH